MDGLPFSTPSGAPAANAPLRPRRLTDAQVRVIRMSVARACTDAEFDHFIAVAERTGLDPLRRQISAIVLSQNDPDKRSMIPLATIDGLRAIAARHGDYRPMESAPVIEFESERIDPTLNPLGIVRAEVKVWRRFDREWFAITGEAWWDEYAALSAPAERQAGEAAGAGEGAPGIAGGQRAQVLAANWRRMGRILIAKCAEAQALRRGWPEDLSGLYGEEELHRAELEQILGHERAERAEEQTRQRALAGRRQLLLSFDASGSLESIERDALPLKLAAFIATATDAESLEAFQARNRDALRTFWEWAPGDALDIKRQTERALARLKRESAHASAATQPKTPPSIPQPGTTRKRTGRRKVPQAADQGDQAPAT